MSVKYHDCTERLLGLLTCFQSESRAQPCSKLLGIFIFPPRMKDIIKCICSAFSDWGRLLCYMFTLLDAHNHIRTWSVLYTEHFSYLKTMLGPW